MQDKVEVAPLRFGAAIKGWIIIYGLTIITNYILNAWMKAAPIGPWVGEDILKWYWFDNVCYMLFSLWWCFLFIAVGNWPFHNIQNAFTKGIVLTIVCWIIGWFNYKAIYWLGLGAGWAFPVVGSMYFLLVFFAYTGEGWFYASFSQGRQFGLLIILIFGFTWLLTKTVIRWVPPWWFPFCQMGLATGMFAYLFRNIKQPMKSILMWLLMFLGVAIWLYISAKIGIWDLKLDGVSPAFWNIGLYGADMEWLLLFFCGCAFVYGILVPLHNWPFTLIPMPWGGWIASICIAIFVIIMTAIIKALIGPVFADMNEALTYGYMGVAWSFFIPLFFGVGLTQPYLWTGQKTPGTWDDVD